MNSPYPQPLLPTDNPLDMVREFRYAGPGREATIRKTSTGRWYVYRVIAGQRVATLIRSFFSEAEADATRWVKEGKA